MAVVPSVSFSQSPDGKTLTIIDTSDYSTGSIGAYTRVAEIWSSINGTGTLLYTLPFTGTDLEVSQQITSDRYMSAKLIFTGSPAVATVYANFATDEFEYILLNDILGNGCGCTKSNNDKVKFGYMYLSLVPRAVLSGNSARTNNYLNSAKAWLS